MRAGIAANPGHAAAGARSVAPVVRSWLEGLAVGHAEAQSFAVNDVHRFEVHFQHEFEEKTIFVLSQPVAMPSARSPISARAHQ